MKNYKNICQKRAQTFLEYTIFFGVIASLLIAMTPFLRRGVQAMVKVVADQVGVQQKAEQINPAKGYVRSADTLTNVDHTKKIKELGGDITYNLLQERIATYGGSETSLGFSENRRTDQSN